MKIEHSNFGLAVVLPRDPGEEQCDPDTMANGTHAEGHNNAIEWWEKLDTYIDQHMPEDSQLVITKKNGELIAHVKLI